MEVTELGEDPAKGNFCFLKVTKPTLSPEEEEIVDRSWFGFGSPYVSPVKMFDLLLSSMDRVLTDMDHQMVYHGSGADG